MCMCVIMLQGCAGWVSHGYCDHLGDDTNWISAMMHEQCPDACGLCNSMGGWLTVAPTPAPTDTCIHPVDRRTECPTWHRLGFCDDRNAHLSDDMAEEWRSARSVVALAAAQRQPRLPCQPLRQSTCQPPARARGRPAPRRPPPGRPRPRPPYCPRQRRLRSIQPSRAAGLRSSTPRRRCPRTMPSGLTSRLTSQPPSKWGQSSSCRSSRSAKRSARHGQPTGTSFSGPRSHSAACWAGLSSRCSSIGICSRCLPGSSTLPPAHTL